MIIGGGSRSNSKWFSRHLMNGRDNEVVRVAEIRGLPVDNIVDAFEEMQLIASASPQCVNFFYHADLNTRADERLTEQQWDKAIDTLERNLGLEGQSRVVIEHDKNGRVHRHVIWSRIDPDTMRAIPDSHNYDIHMRTADELEKEFDHERTPRGRGPDGPNPKNYEVFRGKDSGISPYDVGEQLTGMWRHSDNWQAFAAAVDEHGYILARGRRGVLAVDPAGDEHSLARRIAGARKKDIDARMEAAGVDINALPTVDAARALARQRAAEQAMVSEDVFNDRDKSAPDPFTEAVKEAMRTRKDRSSEAPAPSPEPLDRFERQQRQSMNLDANTSPLLDPLERFEQDTRKLMDANGGELPTGDGLRFWERAALVWAHLAEHATSWVERVKSTFQDFVGRFRQRDDRPDPDDKGFER